MATANQRVAYLDSSALATHLGGPLLRSLDAVHLATAVSVRGDLGALITYDVRMISEA